MIISNRVATSAAIAAAAVLTIIVGGSTATATPASAGRLAAARSDHGAVHTTVLTVYPVSTTGRHAAGYTVHHSSTELTCNGTAPAAVHRNIDTCSTQVAIQHTCWKAAHAHRVFCLSNARGHRLTEHPRRGGFPKSQPLTRAAPLNLRLGDDAYCTYDGDVNAVLPGHPSYRIWYQCDHGRIVWGPDNSHRGLNRSHGRWTVRTTHGSSSKLHRRHVDRAWLVDTLH